MPLPRTIGGMSEFPPGSEREDYIDSQVALFGLMVEIDQFKRTHQAIMDATGQQFDLLDGLIDDLAAGKIDFKPKQP